MKSSDHVVMQNILSVFMIINTYTFDTKNLVENYFYVSNHLWIIFYIHFFSNPLFHPLTPGLAPSSLPPFLPLPALMGLSQASAGNDVDENDEYDDDDDDDVSDER